MHKPKLGSRVYCLTIVWTPYPEIIKSRFRNRGSFVQPFSKYIQIALEVTICIQKRAYAILRLDSNVALVSHKGISQSRSKSRENDDAQPTWKSMYFHVGNMYFPCMIYITACYSNAPVTLLVGRTLLKKIRGHLQGNPLLKIPGLAYSISHGLLKFLGSGTPAKKFTPWYLGRKLNRNSDAVVRNVPLGVCPAPMATEDKVRAVVFRLH